MTQIHSSQIKSIDGGFNSLYEQLRALDIENDDVDIDYEINEDGQVLSETINDMSTNSPTQLKRVVYVYDEDGNVESETLTVGSKTITKTYSYDEQTGLIKKISIRKVLNNDSV
ncbi:hypothetical protein ACSVDA_11925 [Cytobacillus sp. Hm23]